MRHLHANAGDQDAMSYRFQYLLAKRSKAPDAPEKRETLTGHILDVMGVADTLVRSWGGVFLASMGLPEGWGRVLLSASLRGALIHDLGKANHQFQRLVRWGPHPPQAFRHELISLHLILHLREIDRWVFADGGAVVRMAALFAAVGHHLQIADAGALYPRDGSGDSSVMVLAGHPDVTDLLHRAGERLSLSSLAPGLTDLTIDLLDDDSFSETRRWIQEANGWWNGASPDERRLVALVKALVIAADVAGSAVPRTGADAAAWAEGVLSRTCQREEVEDLAKRALEGKPLRRFQREVAETPSRITLVRAGCGSGKTTAAYLWGARNAAGRKLFFCYPTTGTATEGYAEYILPDDIDAALIHSRAEVDLDALRGAPDCDDDQQARIEALEAWDVPLVVCTADTVLGLIQNNRRALFSFPAIANGAFVFDEVHAYDDRMFGSLVRFLQAFRGIPMLLMTASLPQDRLNVLRDIAANLGEPLVEVQGSQDLEKIARYRLEPTTAEEVWNEIAKVLSAKGKVLWVANTVGRAVFFGKSALERGLNPVLPYHSRYRYCDRLEKHRAVIEAFKQSGPVLAVTTQVCEVSLNLSADLLVTDLAPVAALIQRLGRLNRYATVEKPGEPRKAMFLEPGQPLPYGDADLESARKWLKLLGGEPVSQADLAQAFIQLASQTVDTQSDVSLWLDGGPFSAPGPLREPGTTIPVIRAEDEPAARKDRKQVVRLTCPMPLRPVLEELGSWSRVGMAWMAPLGRSDYSTDWGATWRK